MIHFVLTERDIHNKLATFGHGVLGGHIETRAALLVLVLGWLRLAAARRE